MRRVIKGLFIIFMSIMIITGCSNKKEVKPTTPATILADSFVETVKSEKDLYKVAQKLTENEVIQTKMMIQEKTNNDYLNGFDAEIKEFEKAYVMQPIISSIPFIMYVFETNDVQSLEKELKENSNPRWNICVEADETFVKSVDNYVFFVMAPKSFGE